MDITEGEKKYLNEVLPTEFSKKFGYAVRILIYTYTPIEGILLANWASYEKKKNIQEIKSFINTTKYKFDQMDSQELVEVFIKELTEFIEASVVTQQVSYSLYF
jgi:uncharacterized protein (DUF1697 family)